jgi:uncharacterized protein (TIGR02145 family)
MKPVLLIGSLFLILNSFCAQKTVTDVDGNVYHTVTIGSQVWTAENLRTTKFNDGSPIPCVPDSIVWHSLTSPGYCYFRNTSNPDSIRKNGALYNWHCIGTGKLAPAGWHVPTNDDWMTLRNYLIEHGYNWDRRNDKEGNRIAKSLAARNGWKPFTVEGTPGNAQNDNNRSGFSGRAVGFRFDSRDTVAGTPPKSGFGALSHTAVWWSATSINETDAYSYGLGFCVERLIEYNCFIKTSGFSVRLVKDSK